MDNVVIKNGIDVDVSRISLCPYHSMDECERYCGVYTSCKIIMNANELLILHDKQRRERYEKKTKSN